MERKDAFRQQVRDWLEQNCPPSLCDENSLYDSSLTLKNRQGDAKLWLQRMAEKGWTAPNWPKQYGGGGLDLYQHKILRQEMKRLNAPTPFSGMGLSMIGPTLLELGSEDQKQRHISKIVAGEVHWCQGYSEPNAGSDLANLQTKAEDKGDYFLINGSKIWTSGAMHADWMFCLVRTNFEVQKQKGISFVLFPMTDPGVTIKPIKLISGESPFCQVFFDNVKANKSDLVGQVNEGWTVGKRLLQFERSSIGGGMGGRRGSVLGANASLLDLAKTYRSDEKGNIEDPLLKQQIIEQEMNSAAFSSTTARIREEAMSGKVPGFATSVMKYYSTEMAKRKSELMISILGPQGLGREGEQFSQEELNITKRWLFDKALTIAGGSSEVQLNIIAKRILQLPDA